MSAMLESEGMAVSSASKSGSIDIREGDWKSYLQHLAKYNGNPALADRYGDRNAYQRACALAYLGRRAQVHGGVYSTRHPHIMTPQYLADLEASNKATRYTRYPWLRALMTLLAEIEQIQDQISGTNVLSFNIAGK